MKRNVGGLDRTARLVIGVVLVLIGVAGYIGLLWVAFGPVPQALGSVVIVLIGLILVATGLTRRCPINSLLGRDTYRQDSSR
ncbi:MAG: YgaP family membrane protein [Halobacteriota archaeon]